MKRIFVSLLLSFICISVQAGEIRKAKITWREVSDAVKYDFEISASPQMDPLIQRKNYDSAPVSLELEPGTYYFRVRGIDKSGAPGPWSEVTGFVVNPAAPAQVNPDDKEKFEKKIPEAGIRFKWKSGVSGSKYVIQIQDKKGMLFKRNVNATDFSWRPAAPGEYKWRVGYETPAGDEWGPWRSFSVTKIGIEGEAAIPEPAKPIAEPAPPPALPSDDDYGKGRGSEWSVLGRVGESAVAYSGTDKDSGKIASGSAIVGFVSAELRWRQGKPAGDLWTWSGALNFEMIKQSVLDTDFYLPRGNLRVFYGKETGPWRYGPFFQVGASESAIFIVETATTAIEGKVLRQNAGVGPFATFRSGKVLVSGIVNLRMDVGGNSTAIPNPLNSSLGFEAGVGVVAALTPTLQIESRLRLLQETYDWTPAKGGAGGDSSLSDTFIILDVGVGWRF